jgi:acyl-CoA dehydrogenase
MGDLDAFRTEARQWMEANAPKSLLGKAGAVDEYWGGRRAQSGAPTDARRWCEVMASRGWTAPTWPTTYGGGGLSRTEARALDEEIQRLGVPRPLSSFGLTMLGPTLLQFGTEEQKQEHLPPIVRGEIRWSQGYSEPNSGSDLASLATSAVREGDEFVINGQKIWTSYGDEADWMFVLVRTDTSVPKQQGISFLLVDMAQPGVEVRPIRLISGYSPFCETFFTDARAKASNVVGGLHNGWTVAKALLTHERTMIADVFGTARRRGGASDAGPPPLARMAQRYLGGTGARVSDPIVRDQVTRILMDQTCFEATVRRNADAMRAGQRPGPETSMFKIYGTELNQRREEAMLAIRGPQALGWEGDGFADSELGQTRDWLRSRGNTIEGGTSEVQLNIIAKRVLSLPD